MEVYKFAFLDTENKVINVALFDSENPDIELLDAIAKQSNAVDYKSCTVHGECGIGYSFIDKHFVQEKPYPSWVLNTDTYQWESPIGLPIDVTSIWDEETLSWKPMFIVE